MNERTSLWLPTILVALGACAGPEPAPEAPPVADPDQEEAFDLRTLSDDDCVVVPRPQATAYHSNLFVDAESESGATREYRLHGNSTVSVRGSHPTPFELRSGRAYDLKLTPDSAGGFVLAEIEEQGSSRSWSSNLRTESHSLDQSRIPSVVVRPRGRKHDDVDFYWPRYSVSLRITHP